MLYAASRNATPSVPRSSSICCALTMSGGDRAMVSPVNRVHRHGGSCAHRSKAGERERHCAMEAVLSRPASVSILASDNLLIPPQHRLRRPGRRPVSAPHGGGERRSARSLFQAGSSADRRAGGRAQRAYRLPSTLLRRHPRDLPGGERRRVSIMRGDREARVRRPVHPFSNARNP